MAPTHSTGRLGLSRPASFLRPRLGHAAALILTAASIAFAWWYQSTTYLNPDIGWLLHLARSSMDGAVLYRDLIEINPPLIVWLLYPVVCFSQMTGMPLDVATRLAVGLLALGMTLWSIALVEPKMRWPALPLLTFVALVVPSGAFGQREHLLTLFLWPSLALVVRRARGDTVAAWMALAIGATAATGVALKPHFALIWVGTAAYLAARLGLRRFLQLPETITVLVAAPIYLLAITLATPDYWTVVHSFGPLYLNYLANPRWIFLLQAKFLAALLCTGLWLLGRGRLEERVLQDVLGIAVVGAVLGVVAQGKMFHYHYLPATSLTVLLAVSLLGRWRPLTGGTFVLLVLCGQLLYQQFTGEWRELNRRTGPRVEFEALFTSVVKPNDHVTMLLWHLSDAWPLALRLGGNYDYPMPSIWWVRAQYPRNYWNAGGGTYLRPEEMDATEHHLFDLTAKVLLTNRPQVIVLPSDLGRPSTHQQFDFLGYLSQDPRLKTFFSAYALEVEYSRWLILRRLDED